MRLYNLLKNVKTKCIFYGNIPIFKLHCTQNIASITINSKTATKNCLFIALKGSALNGEDYIKQAIKKGANVIVCENKIAVPKNITLVVVNNARIALAQISSAFYKHAHKKLKIVGITGTNGKSSSCYILHQVLNKLSEKNPNLKCGLIGTNAVIFGNQKMPATLTTPDPILLHEIFYKMVKAKVKICVMEVSSHSIYFSKIFGINFEYLCLTNVKSDHLDFFKTQQNYEYQKQRLFFEYNAKKVVLNLNDKVGDVIAKNLKNVPIFGYLKQNSKNSTKHSYTNVKKCEYNIVSCSLLGTKFNLNLNGKGFLFDTNLLGEVYVQNLCLALGVLLNFDISVEDILNQFKNLYIEGRVNIINYNTKINFILDYAHTISSTKAVLKLIKSVSSSQNFIVVGAPGNRDEFKRKKTAQICEKFGKVILTSDNPKYENPYKIMEEMKKGTNNAVLIENRKTALTYALKLALKTNKPSNIIVLGKGIENYQDYNNNHQPFSDLEVITNLVENKH